MMMNLFSTFDPCTGSLSLNWLSSNLTLMMITMKFWVTNNKISILNSKMSKKLHQESMMIMPMKGSSLMLISMFSMIMMSNIMGLLPYTFTPSSQLIFSMSIALPTWITMMMYGWTKKTKKMLAHTVPSGTPYMLMPLMVMIETTSNMIRPGALSVRLSANMIAGHLLMALLGANNSTLTMTMIMTMLIMMMMFETAVSIIQSYVFMTLMTLYSSEI